MTARLWTWDAFLGATGGRPVGPPPETISGISIDSRTIRPGEAFFAIRGDSHDGHDFVSIALAAGAATAVVGEDRLAALGRITGSLTVADDVLVALTGVGIAARLRSNARIAAITGSVGKTTTKEMLATALARRGRGACVAGLVQQSLGRAADARPHAARGRNTASSRSA